VSIEVHIPAPLRAATGGNAVVSVPAGKVRDALAAVSASHPEFAGKLFEGAALKRFINVFVNDEDIRYLDNLDTAVKDGDEISIIPAVAGG
jgi:molybdopterin converting factor small subunit